MNLGYAEKGKECLTRWVWVFFGLRGIIYELVKLIYKLKYGKVTRITESLERLGCVYGVDVVTLLKWSLGGWLPRTQKCRVDKQKEGQTAHPSIWL